MIEVARRIAADVQTAEFIAANIKDAPLPDAIADVIFCNGSLHHMTGLPGVMGTLNGSPRLAPGSSPGSRSAGTR